MINITIQLTLCVRTLKQAKMAAAEEEEDGEGGGGGGWHEEYLLAKAVSIRTRKVRHHLLDMWLR